MCFFFQIFQARNLIDALGKAASGGSPDQTNWRGIIASTLVSNPSSVDNVSEVFHDQIIWRFTWKDIRARETSCHHHPYGPAWSWSCLEVPVKVPEGPQRSSWIIDLAYVCCDDLRSMLTTLWTSLDTIKSCFFPSSHLCCLTSERNSSIKLRTIENVTVQQPPDDTLLWWRLFCFPQSLTACAST